MASTCPDYFILRYFIWTSAEISVFGLRDVWECCWNSWEEAPARLSYPQGLCPGAHVRASHLLRQISLSSSHCILPLKENWTSREGVKICCSNPLLWVVKALGQGGWRHKPSAQTKLQWQQCCWGLLYSSAPGTSFRVLLKSLNKQICIEPDQNFRMKQQTVNRKALESTFLNSQQEFGIPLTCHGYWRSQDLP